MTLPAVIVDLNLSETLKQAITTPLQPVYGNDSNPYGFDMLPAPWQMPRTITPRMIDEAKRQLPRAEQACQPPARDEIRNWLAMVGVLCAGKMPAEDARTKTRAYAEFLDHPAAVFTPKTAEAASREFKQYGFPSHGRIAEFLDKQAAPIRDAAERLRRIADATPSEQAKPRGPGYNDVSAEEQARIDRKVAEAKALLEQPCKYSLAPEKVEMSPRHAQQRAQLSAAYDAEIRARHGDPDEQEPII